MCASNVRQRCVVSLDDAPNYYPNSFSGPEAQTAKLDSQFSVSGDVARYNTADDDNFTQVGDFWRKVRHFSGDVKRDQDKTKLSRLRLRLRPKR